MGKKAKIRKKRRQQTNNNPAEQPKTNSHDFIKKIEKTGYRKENFLRSPEVPKDKIEPII